MKTEKTLKYKSNAGYSPVISDFGQPHEITENTNIHSLLPTINDIPDEFNNQSNKWHRIVTTWFFNGISKNHLKVKSGIDYNKAFRHIACVINDWGLKHEHKLAGAAFLMSLWFDDDVLSEYQTKDNFFAES